MKNYVYSFSLVMLLGIFSSEAFAYDIEVVNADGVKIYYNYINNGQELEVAQGNKAYSGTVNIPETITYMNRTRNVTAIGTSAFHGCAYLNAVTLPSTLKTIGSSSFESCKGLTSITIPDHVTDINANAFDNCTGIPSVVIPNSVVTIGENAFRNCNSLTSLTIGNSVKTIRSNVFAGCSKLTSVVVPNSVTFLGDFVFSRCGALTSVTLPEGLTTISSHTFSNCNHLESVTIPNSVTSIGDNAFSYCEKLSAVTIPDNVTSIDQWAFSRCKSLTSLTIGKSVESIGLGAFYECTSLRSVEISSSVTSIGKSAFELCNIETVFSFIENPFTIIGKSNNNRSFSTNTYNNATLHVPVGTLSKYKATTGWKDFMFIEEDLQNQTGISQSQFSALKIVSNQGVITVLDAHMNAHIAIYAIDGHLVGSARADGHATSIVTNLRQGEVAVVKIDGKTVKTVMK